MGLVRWLRSWWWLAVGAAALLAALLITLVDVTGNRMPVAEPVVLQAPEPLLGSPPLPEIARIPGCGMVRLELAAAAPGFVGEPFPVRLTVDADDDCPIRARLATVGTGEIAVTPDGVLTRSIARGTPAEFMWRLVADAPGPAVASVAILAAENDDVVADLTREISVEPSRRRHEGIRWLERRLDDLVVTATTADGRALRVGQPGLLTVQVSGPVPGPATSGLEPLARLRTCVELTGAGMAAQECWESTVDVTGPVEVQHRLPVRAEGAGTITMTGDLSLAGTVDGADLDLVSTPFSARPAGNATVPVVERLRTVEQTAVRWLAVAGGAALVVGVVARLVRRVRGGIRARSRPAVEDPPHPRDEP